MTEHERMNYWWRRAKAAEAERDEWEQAAIRLADASNTANVRIDTALHVLDEDQRWQDGEHTLARIRQALDG